MPKKGENIYKRKDGRWEGRYPIGRNGKKIRYGYVYAKTYTEAKKLLLQKRADTLVDAPKGSASSPSSVAFSALSEEWLLAIQGMVKDSTIIKYRNLLTCSILPHLGTRTLAEIDYSLLCAFRTELLEHGGRQQNGLSEKTTADALSITKSILKYGLQKKHQIDQTAFLVAGKVKTTLPRVLSIAEEDRLVSFLLENQELASLGILVCLFTGIRIGELCALTWDDICFDSNTIHIHRTMQRLQIPGEEGKTAIRITEPKSQCSIRDIPIAEGLLPLLMQQPHKEGFLLTGERFHYIEPRTMQNRFHTIMQKCQIQDAHFHTLRHTFATRCIEVGFDVKSLSEILGHANVSITLNRYVHPSMNLKQENMNKLSKLFPVT